MSEITSLLKDKEDFFSAKSASVNEIEDAEKELGLKFAADYSEYLLTFGVVSYFGHELTGICKSKRLNVVDVSKKQHEKQTAIPLSWYVIEETNMDGIVIWQSGTGEIYLSDARSSYRKIANSLADYVK